VAYSQVVESEERRTKGEEREEVPSAVPLCAELHRRAMRVAFVLADGWIVPQAEHKVRMAAQGGELHPLLELIPHCVQFQTRVQVFYELLEHDQDTRTNRARSVFGPQSFHQVRRNRLLEDGLEHFGTLSPEDLREVFRVQFVDETEETEAGIDGGGLFKEFLILLSREAVAPTIGLFKVTAENLAVPNPSAHVMHGANVRETYRHLGRAIGKAIYEGVLLEPRFAEVFLNLVLGGRNSINDVASLDPELYRSLLYVKNCPDEEVESLALTFSITNSEIEQDEIDLIPGGRSMAVTAENRIKYLHLMAHFRTNVAIQQHAKAFASGLSDVVSIRWLRMFTPTELNELISGSNKGFDVDDLMRNCIYSGGYTHAHPTIVALWKVVRALSEEEKAQLLMFVTSCSRPPLAGFAMMQPKFAIHLVPERDRLPTASTCANLLKLPDYQDAKLLEGKLRQSIVQNTGFNMS
jgi:ubiquitin-protein ligase E3 C